MEETEFVARLRGAGARVFVVGGWVRDRLRGVPAKDKDYVVSGIEAQAFCALFPAAKRVGRSFPVYLLDIGGRSAEVAFARRERKTGTGYRGFAVAFSLEVTIEEDLYRRDTTMNSLAIELPSGVLLDPYGGQEDIARGRVRAISAHFLEDPVRALRAARQAALFGYEITETTLDYMRACRAELAAEPKERVFGELRRALEAAQPSLFFRWLARADLLSVTFPELAALIGKTQPAAFHPEGDAFEHTLLVLDRVAAATPDVCARFAGLAHDLGKGTTPVDMLPHHYGHEVRGLDVLAAWNARMTLPKTWRDTAAFVIREHMRAARLEKAGKIVRFLLAAVKLPLRYPALLAVLRADHGDLPAYLVHGEAIARELLAISGAAAPETLQGKAVGDWLLSQRVQRCRSLLAHCED